MKKYYARDRVGRFASFKSKAKKALIVILLIAGLSAGGYFTLYNFLLDSFIYAHSGVNFKAETENRTNKEIAIDYLKQRGFTDEMLFQYACLMYYENRSYDEYAFYVNKNGSLDRGFLMHSSKTAPYQISNKCSFNMMCSLEKFADYILNGGNWDRWLGYKNYCK